ncbi:hypothetical protein [Rathayibacter sp. VKM Ac-2927]|uniref:hypothetical protein n=1 Tax=Rathayibacter sp. VKM Ac-2927 TaxID=2929478 RepID=UPI001FB53853|nr:hypothetical protein [Rathayibacter sp. VKM Ac-2927]MCJ1686204.1 hypothetical protein [Rathayibacter sp. VKM Ac-2927]
MTDAGDPRPTLDRDAMLKLLTDALYVADDPELDQEAIDLGWRAIAAVRRKLHPAEGVENRG